jgi:hypothetical protein
MRGDRRRTRKSHCHRRAKLNALRDKGCRRKGQERVVGILGCNDRIEAGALGDARHVLSVEEIVVGNLGDDAHALCLPRR